MSSPKGNLHPQEGLLWEPPKRTSLAGTQNTQSPGSTTGPLLDLHLMPLYQVMHLGMGIIRTHKADAEEMFLNMLIPTGQAAGILSLYQEGLQGPGILLMRTIHFHHLTAIPMPHPYTGTGDHMLAMTDKRTLHTGTQLT